MASGWKFASQSQKWFQVIERDRVVSDTFEPGLACLSGFFNHKIQPVGTQAIKACHVPPGTICFLTNLQGEQQLLPVGTWLILALATNLLLGRGMTTGRWQLVGRRQLILLSFLIVIVLNWTVISTDKRLVYSSMGS